MSKAEQPTRQERPPVAPKTVDVQSIPFTGNVFEAGDRIEENPAKPSIAEMTGPELRAAQRAISDTLYAFNAAFRALPEEKKETMKEERAQLRAYAQEIGKEGYRRNTEERDRRSDANERVTTDMKGRPKVKRRVYA